MQDLIRQTPVQAESREQLQALLNRASGGVIFTTLQKFGEVAEPLTLRSNVVVIADEAHRSQYGLKARMDVKTGKVSYGFAKYMRDALPHASFIGFTGTPIEATDVNTRRCSATTSTSTTSAARSKTARRCHLLRIAAGAH